MDYMLLLLRKKCELTEIDSEVGIKLIKLK